MTAVLVQGLTKKFGETLAVNNISLSIGDGEFVSLLGPSGCGKTTTLRMLAGFEDVTSGSIEFDGRDVVNVPAEKRDIGMVFQNYALFPHMTVAQNLAFGLEMRRVERAEIERRIAEVLDMVQMVGLADRYPRQLSGGQQQRVALARALVIEPRILLLDEPLANLDARLRDEMRIFIRELQKRVGITTVYVTHDQAEALTMSDKIVVMFGGEIAQFAEPDTIYRRPSSKRVAAFVGQVNLIEGTVSAATSEAATIDFGFLSVETPHAEGLVAGDRVTLALRPEEIQMDASAEDGISWQGEIVGAIYSGSLMDYEVRIANGKSLTVQNLARSRFNVGDVVTLSASPASFWPVRDEA